MAQELTKQLQFDNDKYLISDSLYTHLITQTNHISDYNKCRAFVRNELMRSRNEVKEVISFKKRKIDIEL